MSHKGNFNRWFVVGALAILTSLARMSAAVIGWEDNVAWAMIRDAWISRTEPLLDPPCTGSASVEPAVEYFEGRAATTPLDLRIKTKLGAGQWLAGRCEQAVGMWLPSAQAGDLPAAFQMFRMGQASQLPPTTRLALAQYAYNYGLKLGPSEAAMAWFERSFETLPLRVSASQLASRWRTVGQNTEILKIWQTLATTQPETQADHWWAVAELAALNDDWLTAAEDYATGASLSENAYDYWIRSGSAWERAKQWAQAIAAYDQARQLHPEYGSAYLRLGHVNHIQERYPEALFWYQEAQRRQPDEATAYYYAAEVYLQQGQVDQAQTQIDRALQLDSTHQASWYLAAQIAQGQGKFAVAEANLLSAIQHEPNTRLTANWWIELGDWRRQMDDCAGAGDAYRRAGEVGAEQAMIERRLVELATACGQK